MRMLARQWRLAGWMIAATLFGCGERTAQVPRIDLSHGSSYGVIEFKDEAPANVSINCSDFPASFVDSQGQPVDLTKYRGKKKVVVVVLRGMPQSPGGEFCPSCLAQTSSLLANQVEFERREVEVLVVFPGPTERLGEFLQSAKRSTPGEPDRRFRVLLDRECGACDRLGIRADLAKPSTYILDQQGNIVYAYVGATSTDRPSVKSLFAQLDKLQ
jgi:peroxiredoxin